MNVHSFINFILFFLALLNCEETLNWLVLILVYASSPFIIDFIDFFDYFSYWLYLVKNAVHF